MTTLDRLGADDLRRVASTFRDALRDHEDGINRLNVYPVPDGDTGTNMALTMESVVAEIDAIGNGSADLAAVCQAIGHGSLMGARGNSGVILSQILRGFTQVLARAEVVDGAAFSEALTAASKGAYEAVGNPVEGTILTVMREAAEGAAVAAKDTSDLPAVVAAALEAGRDSLARTPDLLQVLADAGVVDSGGTGLVLFLYSARNVIDGRPLPEASVTEAVADAGSVEQLQALAHGPGAEGDHAGLAGLRYEVMYFLEAPDAAIGAFKDVWTGIGDSIVVVGGDGIYNCHIHTDDIGASIEAAVDIGRPSKIRVTDLLEEVEEERWVREAEEGPRTEPEPVTTAVVAIATGDGIKRIFHSLGVQQVITGGQSMNPSTAQILAAVEAVNAEEVVVLPNNKNIIAVAEQVDATTSKTVRVVPTRGIAEGFAALIAYDPEAPSDENAEEMAEAAAHVVSGEVTMAVRDSTCDVGPIAEGDYLGIARTGIRAVTPSAAEAAIGLLAELLDADHEILTLIEGEGATAGDTRRITEWLSEHHPEVVAEVHQGGQPLYPYFLGVE